MKRNQKKWHNHVIRMERVFHEMERAFGYKMRQWDDASDEEKDYSRGAVLAIIWPHADANAKDAHERMMAYLSDWTFGLEFSVEKKTHPEKCEFSRLSDAQVQKICMQLAVVRASRDAFLVKEGEFHQRAVDVILDDYRASIDRRRPRASETIAMRPWRVNPADVPGPRQ